VPIELIKMNNYAYDFVFALRFIFAGKLKIPASV